jgi:heptosyltransferase III
MKRGKAFNRVLDFYLGIPLLNLLASFRRARTCPECPSRIGLLFNPALGDTLLASAAAQDIRCIFPEAKLILFATSSNVAAAQLLPAIDAIEILPITHPFEAIRTLRRSKLDLMLDLTSWQRLTAIYSFLSGARFTVGFERAKQFRHRGYDKTVSHAGDCHELENHRRLTRSLGSKTSLAPRLIVPGGPLPRVAQGSRQIVAFHAWASGPRGWMREWPDERWADLARQLMVPGRVFLLTGSPAEEARCDALFHRLVAQGTAAEVLIGREGIEEIARVLTHAEMLVSVNTGIMHLGAILGVPTISLNGPTAVHRWGPVGPRVANVCPPDGSGGFLDLGFEYGGHSTGEMDKIRVSDVMCAIEALFGIPRGTGINAARQNEREQTDSRAAMVYERGERAAVLQTGNKPAESK